MGLKMQGRFIGGKCSEKIKEEGEVQEGEPSDNQEFLSPVKDGRKKELGHKASDYGTVVRNAWLDQWEIS